MNERIFYTKPSITEREVALATDAARNGWGANCYAYIQKLEKMFQDYTGAEYAIATSSCTGALHMGMAALGIGPGDEVILADTNWIASAAPITYLGANPVFVDVLADSWCIDPEKIEEAITPKTKAILAVHLYGNMCALDELLRIGREYGLPVIEDSAEALGSRWFGKHAGTLGAFGSFSFHGSKTMTTGEGGMFITNDHEFYDKVLTLSNHGRSGTQTKQFWADEVGFKYKMSNIQAAIGCGQMERIEELVGRKREIFLRYKNRLDTIPGISMNADQDGVINGYWMPTVVFDKQLGVTRDDLINAFSDANIDARVFFWPLSALDMFESVRSNVNAWDIPERAINIPSYHDMRDDHQDRVIAVIEALARDGAH